MKIAMVAAAAVLLAGCAAQPTVVHYNITAPYDHEAAKAAMAPGDGSISGTAFMRQRGGGVVTCAGEQVTLFPDTEYARQRLSGIYGHAPSAGEVLSYDVRKLISTKFVFEPDAPEYKADARSVKCDGQGEFTFDAVKDGGYFILTGVKWEVGALLQGAALVTKVEVFQGKALRAIMSR